MIKPEMVPDEVMNALQRMAGVPPHVDARAVLGEK